MDFRFIHVYSDAATPALDAQVVASEIVRIFPSCKIDVRSPFRYDDRIEQARISDTKQPFEKQSKQAGSMMPLYDGFVLQRIFSEMIPAAEKSVDHVHIIFTGLLTCTFSEDDWRYHGRAVVCGTPSIISTAGIVEAPAKPKDYYLAQLGGMADPATLKRQFAGRFIDYGDGKMTAAAAGYALQSIFFFVADGEPFCENRDCRLYNAHWQEELVHTVERGTLCSRHQQIVNKFNKGSGSH